MQRRVTRQFICWAGSLEKCKASVMRECCNQTQWDHSYPSWVNSAYAKIWFEPQEPIPTSLWGKDWYLIVMGYDIYHFPSQQPPSFLIENYILLLSIFLTGRPPWLCPLSLSDSPHYGGQRGQYVLHLPLATVSLGPGPKLDQSDACSWGLWILCMWQEKGEEFQRLDVS